MLEGTALSVPERKRLGPSQPVRPSEEATKRFPPGRCVLNRLTFSEQLVRKNAQAINRGRLHPQDDRAKGERCAAVGTGERDLSWGEIAFRPDEYEDPLRFRPGVALAVLGQDLFQKLRAGLE